MATMNRFATRPAFGPSLGFTVPPSVPPRTLGFGSYCFKATADVRDEHSPGCPVVVGRVVGYDTSPAIGRRTDILCRAHAKTMDKKDVNRFQCADAQLTILPHGPAGMQCAGEVYFEMAGSPTKRLL